MSATVTPISPDVQDVLHPGYDASTWYGPIASGAVSTSVAIAADVLYFCPIQIFRTVDVVSIAVRVGTAVSANGKLALYGSGTPAGPKSLIAAAVGTVDMNNTAGTSVSLNFASAQTLKPGWYWGASLFDGAAQPNCLNQSAIAAHGLAPFLGAATAAGAIGIVSALSYIRFGVGQLYTQGFPSVVNGVSRSATNPGSPITALLTAA